MIGGPAVAASHAEGDLGEDPIHQPWQVGAEAVVGRQIGAHREVPAADVVADRGGRDVLPVGDDSSDRCAVAEVSVGAQDPAGAVLLLDAAAQLRDDARVVAAVDAQIHERGDASDAVA